MPLRWHSGCRDAATKSLSRGDLLSANQARHQAISSSSFALDRPTPNRINARYGHIDNAPGVEDTRHYA
jgi:hypothetical protein